jgi:hypothetical protein
MTDTDRSIGKRGHLKVGLIFFTAWLFILYILFQNIQELGGIQGLIDEVINGVYIDLILLLFSIYLLAEAIRNLYLYYSSDKNANQ